MADANKAKRAKWYLTVVMHGIADIVTLISVRVVYENIWVLNQLRMSRCCKSRYDICYTFIHCISQQATMLKLEKCNARANSTLTDAWPRMTRTHTRTDTTYARNANSLYVRSAT